MSADPVEFLRGIAAELADIHRGKHYAQWRGEASHRVDAFLSTVEPFAAYANSWVFTGDGGGCVVQGRFGDWAIDRLVEKVPPEEIICRAEEELRRNSAVYSELSPVFGVEIDAECVLAPDIGILPQPPEPFGALDQPWLFSMGLPTGTSSLVQSFTVAPAFERRDDRSTSPKCVGATRPVMEERQAVRRRVRLACLLASPGAVELPIWQLQPDRKALMAAGAGNQAGRPFDAHPLVSMPVEQEVVKRNYDFLDRFSEPASLERAIDRLGRSRLAVAAVDRAIELGMAAEIALMHDHSPSNTEITFKIASRAAWLLGDDADGRAAVFDQMKQLYRARSTAVHSGTMPSRQAVDLDAADRLVSRALSGILGRGRFPDWQKLTMGAR